MEERGPAYPTLPQFSSGLLVVPVLFLVASLYNGPGANYYVFAAFALVAAVVCGVLVSRQLDQGILVIPAGWLPAVTAAYVGWLLLNPFLGEFFYISGLTVSALAVAPLSFVLWQAQSRALNDAYWPRAQQLLMLAGVVLAIWGFGNFFLEHERAHGPLIDPNAYCTILNLLLLPAIHNYLGATDRDQFAGKQAASLVTIGVLALVHSMTFSRGGLLALASILPISVWLNRKQPGVVGRAMVLVTMLVLAYGLVRAAPIEITHITADYEVKALALAVDPSASVLQDNSLSQRMLVWKSTWQIYADNSLLVGTGIGTFGAIYGAYRQPGDQTAGHYAHNDYLQALQEGGIVQAFFLVTLTIVAPLWLLYRANKPSGRTAFEVNTASGLMLGVLAASLHAFVNFIHYLLPIIFLTGLYLARAWEICGPPKHVLDIKGLRNHVRTRFAKAVLYLVLTAVVAAIVVDAVIFLLFTGNKPLINALPTASRLTVAQLFSTLSPNNLVPREVIINHLVELAGHVPTEDARETLLAHAQRETEGLERIAPGVAVWHYHQGRVFIARGTPESLKQAREHFAVALARMPEQVRYRLALVSLLKQLGENNSAMMVVRQFHPWLLFASDLPALTALAHEASDLANRVGTENDRIYWRTVLGVLEPKVRDSGGTDKS